MWFCDVLRRHEETKQLRLVFRSQSLSRNQIVQRFIAVVIEMNGLFVRLDSHMPIVQFVVDTTPQHLNRCGQLITTRERKLVKILSTETERHYSGCVVR